MNPLQPDKVQFAPHLLLLDVRILSETLCTVRRVLSARLGRTLPDLDLVSWLDYIALDAGLRPGTQGEIQLLLVTHDLHTPLPGVVPSSLAELDGRACTSTLGEWSFAVVSSAHLTSGQALFTDLMELALDASEVRTLLLLPYPDGQPAEDVATRLSKIYDPNQPEQKGKQVVYFHLQPLSRPLPCPTESIVFSLMKALGIREEEFQ